MPPAVKRNGAVVLFDINTGEKFSKEARQCLVDIFTKKWYGKEKDVFKLVLHNANETKNCLNLPNICEVSDVLNYTPFVENFLKGQKPGNANWVDGLKVAVELLHEHFGEIKGIVTKQILFITDFNVSTGDISINDMNILSEEINALEAYLYIIGPTIIIPQTLKSIDDITNFMHNLAIPKTDPVNLSFAKQLVQKTENAVICDLNIGEQLFSYYKHWAGPQPFCSPLEVGTKLQIPCRALRCEAKIICKKPGVKRNKYQLITEDDDALEVEPWQLATGHAALGKLVIFTNDVKQSLKFQGPRYFKLLGFVEKTQIPEYYLQGDGTSILLPDPVKKPDAIPLDALITVCNEKHMYGIVQRRYMKDCKPKYYALIPNVELNCFHMPPLAYGHQARFKYIETDASLVLPKEALTSEEKEIFGYLDQLDVSTSVEGEMSKLPLSFEAKFNPFVKRIFVLAGQKATEKPLEYQEKEFLKLDVDFSGQKMWPKRAVAKVEKSEDKLNKSD